MHFTHFVQLIAIGLQARIPMHITELWDAVAPKPTTDDFPKLLDDSFGRDWRRPRSWPSSRTAWAYGFTMAGGTSAVLIGALISATLALATLLKAPTAGVETSQRFRPAQ